MSLQVRHAARLSTIAISAWLIAASLGGCGAGHSAATGAHARARSALAPRRAPRLLTRLSADRLPSPVSGGSVVVVGGRILLLGGLNHLDVSTDEVLSVDSSGRVFKIGMLSQPRHDTAAAQTSGRVLLFAGGSTTELASVESITNGSGTEIGKLPAARSDLSAATVGGYTYIIGGYDGIRPLAEVLRTADGRHYATVTRLPVPIRYAAVGVVGSQIFIFGGELASGEDSAAIQVIDTSAGSARIVGYLPRSISHACAVALGGRIFVLGGRSHETPLRRILSFDPATTMIQTAGKLPIAVTNAAAAQIGETGYLLGGIGTTGQTLDTIIQLRLLPGS